MPPDNVTDMRLCWLSITLIVVTLLALLTSRISDFLIYDREAILNGQIWRLLTGHLVHFSPLHWLYDMSVFAVSAIALELSSRKILIRLILLLALSISSGLLILKPNMAYFGGMSGIACGTLLFWSLSNLKRQGRLQAIWLCMIMLLIIKIGWEMHSSGSLLPYGSQQIYMAEPLSHFIGAITAFIYYLYEYKKLPLFGLSANRK